LNSSSVGFSVKNGFITNVLFTQILLYSRKYMFSDSAKMSKAIFWLQLRTFGLVVGWLEVTFFITSTIYWGTISLLERYERHEKSETGKI